MDLQLVLADPMVQSSALPLAVAFVACGLIRLIGGPGRGDVLAGIGIAIGFLAAYVSIIGWPPLVPRSSGQKLFFLTAAGAVVGFTLDLSLYRRGTLWAVLMLFPAAGIAWLAWPRLQAFAVTPENIRLAVLLVGGWLTLHRLDRLGPAGTDPAVMLLFAALGVGGVAIIGSSASIAQMAFALAAAAGGFVLWNWPWQRYLFSGAAVFGGGGALVFLATQMTFFTGAPVEALALLLPVFFADAIAARVPKGSGLWAEAVGPVILGVLCMVVVAAAVGLAYFQVNGTGV